MIILLLMLLLFPLTQAGNRDGMPKIARITNIDQLRSLIHGKNNVLVYYHGDKAVLGNVLIEVAEEVYGVATIAFVYCGDADGKKLCKTMKAKYDPFELKHYSNGEYDKTYDRAFTKKAIARYLLDPRAEEPWEDDSSLKNVIHVNSEKQFVKVLQRKEKTLVMFYAPWCSASKKMRQLYGEIATLRKDKNLIVAVDMTIKANEPISKVYDIKKYPTFHYFDKGAHLWPYDGNRDKKSILSWLDDSRRSGSAAVGSKGSDVPWSEDSDSQLVHLTDMTWDLILKNNAKVLAVFYAPWCGNCAKLRPIMESVVRRSKAEGIKIKVVAVDITKERNLATRYDILSFPRLKYFENEKEMYDVKGKTEEKLINWMRDPKAPPPPISSWSNEKSALVHLDEENHEKEIEGAEHAIVMFYAPWCQHCINVRGEITAYAEEKSHDKNVLVAVMDCTTQPALCKHYGIYAYPGFKYFHDGKEVENYRYGRARYHFREFIAQKKIHYDKLKLEEAEKKLAKEMEDKNLIVEDDEGKQIQYEEPAGDVPETLPIADPPVEQPAQPVDVLHQEQAAASAEPSPLEVPNVEEHPPQESISITESDKATPEENTAEIPIQQENAPSSSLNPSNEPEQENQEVQQSITDQVPSTTVQEDNIEHQTPMPIPDVPVASSDSENIDIQPVDQPVPTESNTDILHEHIELPELLHDGEVPVIPTPESIVEETTTPPIQQEQPVVESIQNPEVPVEAVRDEL